jgi:1-phosphofructokinase
VIVTVTLNPSVDRTVQVDYLRRGTVNRASSVIVDAAGKGVNVARTCHALGAQTHAILAGGGLGGRWIADELTDDGIAHTIVWVPSLTRSNLTLVEADGTVTKINEPGTPLPPESMDDIRAALASLDLAGAWVVLAGGLAPGSDVGTYSELAEYAARLGARVAVDTSEEALAAVVKSAQVDLIKPNQHELAYLAGRRLDSISDVIDAARDLLERGITSALVSLGADGALYVDRRSAVHVEPAQAVAGTPVGAGDVLLGAFIASGADADALPTAVAWSAASVKLPGTSIPSAREAALIDVVRHESVDLHRSLVEVA